MHAQERKQVAMEMQAHEAAAFAAGGGAGAMRRRTTSKDDSELPALPHRRTIGWCGG